MPESTSSSPATLLGIHTFGRIHARTRAARSNAGDRAAAAWPVRDEVLQLHDVQLESGVHHDTIDVRFRLEGSVAPNRDNVVVVVHALTGTPEPLDWWRGVVESGGAIDPTRHAVLTTNLLGGCSGTTGPRNDRPYALSPITVRDQAAVLARVLDSLGVSTPLLVCGGSLGGQVALEFAASFPDRVRAVVVLAAPAAQTAQGLAWNAIMRRAIAIGGPRDGLALARMIGMLSYRTPEGLEHRFGRTKNTDGTFQVNSWLNAHGDKLVARFDAASYGALIDAMDTHDVGRGRGGIAAALAPVASRVTAVGIPGDQLYPAESVREWARSVGATYHDLPSLHGHDAFLLETKRVSAIIREAIDRASPDSVGLVAAIRTATPLRNEPIRNGSSVTRLTWSSAPTNTLRIAVAGCGHVGGNLLNLLAHRADASRAVHVERVLVREPRRHRALLAEAIAQGIVAPHACTSHVDEIVTENIDVLVEAIGGVTTARVLVDAALRRGIRVVTANKALLAECGPRLQQLAQTHGTRIDFEAAVAGAIPVVRCLRSGAAGVGIERVSGILNGTSNYVLDQLSDGASLTDAIANATALGYAEADPTRDLSGEDAEDKLRVLAWLAFGVDPATVRVTRRGIDAETAVWAKQVAREGDRVKLIASCVREHGQLVAHVLPTRVTHNDPFALVSGANNRITIESASAGALVFHGAGAGGRATAGAMLADVLMHDRWGHDA